MEPLRIKYIGNLPGAAPDDTLLVALDIDYCAACVSLRNDLAASYGNFWVREEHHFAWLKTFIEHTGLNDFRMVAFTRTKPRDLLEQRWGLIIPDWLTDDLILDEELLDHKLPPGTHTSVDAALLAPIFGELGANFPWSQAGALAEKASAPATQNRLKESAITLLAWENTLKKWADSNAPSWASEFCGRLRTDPAKLWRDLTIWRLLHGYPDAEQEFALDPAAVAFVRNVPVEALKRMAMSPQGRTLALDQIQPVFERALTGIVSRPRFETLVSAVSGELKEEFAGLESLLGKAQFNVEHGDVESVSRRFAHADQVGEAALARLNLFVQPPKPGTLDAASSGTAAWKKWFHGEYLPYRWWQTQRVKADAEVEETVAKFSEWYCRDFAHVHIDPALSAVQMLTQWRPLILQDAVSLILLVDNLPWFFWDSFERALAVAGLHKHESKDCFAPLPSHTAVCKPAVISGPLGCDRKRLPQDARGALCGRMGRQSRALSCGRGPTKRDEAGPLSGGAPLQLSNRR